ncbi:alpha/beta hydrolase [Algoriphagus lacus]|uniref:Alpha/beta hydrolase n=1 Tax=Algoriphagus lacus TaxID=2056311 RepID=A0A418PPZ4_9BACT|nr:alpha/beta hydrolase [Algoriphagus lacus]RIW14148.1 alpha/beta hydrolase [Algoriphagus lacus]
MKIYSKSNFKDETADLTYFENWAEKLEKNNGRHYERFKIETSLGKTHIWGVNTNEEQLDTLVIFPGARTTALIWDFDKGLDNLNHRMRIFMVETNGLPNLSEGSTPDIKSLDYGIWATEVFDRLKIEKAFIAGASFGGLICMKFGIVSPDRIKAAFLLNPGCLQPFSLTFKNLFYNLLPIIKPNKKNVLKFLDKAIFSKPNHKLSEFSETMLVDYEVFAISRYKDKTQKPYYMDKQLEEVKVDTYLLVGDKDLLFPYQKSIDNAKRQIKSLKESKIYNNVGHGIETYDKALNYIGETIKKYNPSENRISH